MPLFSTPVTARLVPRATEDALRLLLDEGEAESRMEATSPPPYCPRHDELCSGQRSWPHETSPSDEPTQGVGEYSEARTGKWDGLECRSAAGMSGLEGAVPRFAGDHLAPREEEELAWQLWHRGKVKSCFFTADGLPHARDAK